MKKIGILSLLGICLLFTGCFNNRQDLPKNPIVFNETEIDGNWAIENDGKYYLAYSTIKPKGVIGDFNYAFGDCLGYVGDDKNDRIYELNGESADEWLIKYYVNGEMEMPMVLREISINNESYIPESVEEPEEDIPEGGGERITVVTDMCEEEGGSIEELYEWTDKRNVCYFSDDSFCYLDDFAADSCHKGDNKREESNYEYPQDLNGKSMEEAFCSYNDGIIITNEYGDNFCVFEDGGYYELKAFKELGKMPALRGQDEPFCSNHENVVCGVDGVSYVNECWMKSTGMEKDPNAEFVDGKCVKNKNSGEQPQRINDYPEETENLNVLDITDKTMDTEYLINLTIGDKNFDVILENNSATRALYEKLKEGNVVVNAKEYGGFEKVGNLGFSLPREDKQITTQLGDLVLYNGNQVSLFYDSNSWSYTKLGKVQNITESDFGDGDITLTFSLKN